MTFNNYANLATVDKTESEITYEYWYEFLYPRVLDYEIEIDMNFLDKNYEFYKLCRNFSGDMNDLTLYLKDLGYGIKILDETQMIVFINKFRTRISRGDYNIAFRKGVFILAIKCNPTKIVETKDAVKLRVDSIGMC